MPYEKGESSMLLLEGRSTERATYMFLQQVLAFHAELAGILHYHQTVDRRFAE